MRDKIREAFEEFASTHIELQWLDTEDWNPDTGYGNALLQLGYETWSAAIAQQPAHAGVDERTLFESWIRSRSSDPLGTIANGLENWDEAQERYPEPFNSWWVVWQGRAKLSAPAAPAPAPAAQEPVAWGAFHFGGKRDGKLYGHADTEAQIDAYILDVHRSSDSVTLRKGPLHATPPAAEQPAAPGKCVHPTWLGNSSTGAVFCADCGETAEQPAALKVLRELLESVSPLMASWNDVRKGESLNLDRARKAMGKARVLLAGGEA